MIAYDLDGVIVGEIDNNRYPDLLSVRNNHLLPIFQPAAPYCIVTARPSMDAAITYQWAMRYLKEAPATISFRMVGDDPVAHKASALHMLHREYGVHLYVESEAEIVNKLAGQVPVPVVLFSSLIHRGLGGLRPA